MCIPEIAERRPDSSYLCHRVEWEINFSNKMENESCANSCDNIFNDLPVKGEIISSMKY